MFRSFKLCASFFKGRACKLILAVLLLFLGGGYFFFRPSSYYFLIPVDSDEEYWGGVPLFQIGIEDKSYQVELDLGTEMSTLDQEQLDKVDKTFYGTFVSYDMRGNSFETPIYEVPQVRIHDLSLLMMKIRGESPEFISSNIFTGSADNRMCSGRAGRDIFENRNFLLDFARSRMILCESFKYLSKSGYHLKDFIKVPLHINKIGYCLEVDTDTGVKMLLLDTGCSLSILREAPSEKQLALEAVDDAPSWSTRKLIIGSKDFGPHAFDLCEISELLSEIDGILGMDFLRKHAIFFDQDHLLVYVEKCSAS